MLNVRSTVGFLVALALSGALYAQTPTPSPSQSATGPTETGPQPSQDTSPNAASSPHQREVTKTPPSEAAPSQNADPSGASSPHQRDVTRLAAANPGAIAQGAPVQDRSGQTLGSVADVVKSSDARDGYVVVSGTDGSARAVPYSVASSSATNGMIVLDRNAFVGAPKLKLDEVQSGQGWQKKSDKYWQKHSAG
jgi:hypothetical protein